MSVLPAPPPVLTLLARLVEEHAGLHYRADYFPLLAEKATPRALEAGFESLLDYYYFLRYDPAGRAEIDTLTEALVVGETYFFRELPPLRVLVDSIVAGIVANGARARVWSAACATGEEPLTLAMMLEEKNLLGQVDLVASDVSARSLEAAQAGRYGRRSLRALPAAAAERWFDVTAEHSVVRPHLRAAIDWRKVNLVDPAAVAALGAFDVIVCRNVLIYFSDDTTRRVVESLASALRPGGRLLVGVSESLLRFGTTLQCEERGGAFFYTKAP